MKNQNALLKTAALLLCILTGLFSHAFAEWTYPVSQDTLEDALDVLVLVNKENLLDKTYPPEEELVAVDVRKTSSSKIQGRIIAADALKLMFEAAEADGIKLYLLSGYRSYRTQDVMHYNRVEKMGYDDGVVQLAGASDHQTGLGFDVISRSWIDSKLNPKFAKTEEAQWMAANCARFGFIIRYPEGKEDITGIIYEPWHLRFVGVEAASYIMQSGLTLEEFTQESQQYLNDFLTNPKNQEGVTSDTMVF